MATEPQWIYIDTPTTLERFCSELRLQIESNPWLALDTEFMRERTYHPQLCLLQVGTLDSIACIDPLRLDNLDPLLDIIYDARVTKVFHAAHQDLEIFYLLRKAVPTPIFDTQLAAPLLGHPNQAGYAVLVQNILGVTLHKGHARTDWSRRPLSEAQLSYAADDVRYLGQIYVKLREQLIDEGRLGWLDNDFARLGDPQRYACNPASAWKRIRASKRLRGKALAILKAVAAWREETAHKRNIPRNWLLRDDMLCDLAKLAPRSSEELKQVRGIGDKQFRLLEDDVLPLIRTALDSTADRDEPPVTVSPRPTPEQEAVMEALLAVVHLQALQNDMHPATLAGRKDIERWLLEPEQHSELMNGWRREMIGKPLQAMLEGRLSLRIHDGHLQLHDNDGHSS